MKNNDNFIMLPTVDICFAGLMENPKVRKGFIAAILKTSPETIAETSLLPTHLEREYAEDKLGILDVHLLLKNGTHMNLEMQVKYFEYWDERVLFYISKMFSEQLKKGDSYGELQKCIHVSILDFIHFPQDNDCCRTIHLCDDKTGERYSDKLEIQILELKKLPKEVKTGEDLIQWMRFFSGKNRKELEDMSTTNEYLGEAYDTLVKLSADEQKRREYELREKALRDYNSLMKSAEKRGLTLGMEKGMKKGIEQGIKKGMEQGMEQGIEQTKQIFKLSLQGKTPEEIAAICKLSTAEVAKILE